MAIGAFLYQFIKKSRGHKQTIQKQIIIESEPSLQSLAALVLLNHYYIRQDEERDPRMRSIVFNRVKLQLLIAHYRKHKKYICHYCKRKDLIRPRGDKRTAKSFDRMVTIDHVIPISKGGREFDANNMVIACHKCNREKRDLIL